MNQGIQLYESVDLTINNETSLKDRVQENKSKSIHPILRTSHFHNHAHTPHPQHSNTNKNVKFAYQSNFNPQQDSQIQHFKPIYIPQSQNNQNNQLKLILAQNFKNNFFLDQQMPTLAYSCKNQYDSKKISLIQQESSLFSRDSIFSKTIPDSRTNSNDQLKSVVGMNQNRNSSSSRKNLQKGTVSHRRTFSNGIQNISFNQRKQESKMLESIQIQNKNQSNTYKLQPNQRQSIFFLQNKDKFKESHNITNAISSLQSEKKGIQNLQISTLGWNRAQYKEFQEKSTNKKPKSSYISHHTSISKVPSQVQKLVQQINSLKQVLTQYKSTKEEQNRFKAEYYSRFQTLQNKLIEQKRKRKQQKQLYQFKAAQRQINFQACLDLMKHNEQILKQEKSNLINQLSKRQQLLKLQSVEISRLQQIIINKIL